MSFKGIPVVAIGPGSQPAESDGSTLSYIDMPKGMSTYERPAVDIDDIRRFAAARETAAWLSQTLADYRPGDEPKLANLTGLDSNSRQLVNDLLGEGEVSVTYQGAVNARSQESVLTGVWRTFYTDANKMVLHDLLEVASVPHLVTMPDAARRIAASSLSQIEIPAGVINAPSILAELAAAAADFAPDDSPHVINLTLLPMTDEDVEFLDSALGKGPVEILSRAYGKCLMLATAVPNIWWVRYYNSMNTLILNSLEVTTLPQVACAAPEDLRDSRLRLAQILESEDALWN
jgi:hydrogenase-1 operon protein HyaF